MTTATELQEHNALLDDPPALRRQMATDGFLFFRGLVPADEIVALRRQILQICDNLRLDSAGDGVNGRHRRFLGGRNGAFLRRGRAAGGLW